MSLQIIQGSHTPINRQSFGSMCGYENQNVVDMISSAALLVVVYNTNNYVRLLLTKKFPKRMLTNNKQKNGFKIHHGYYLVLFIGI